VSDYRCCEAGARVARPETIVQGAVSGDSALATVTRRGLEMAGWIIPSAILALLPKCPMCVAAYVAVGTGLALSVSTATYLRILLVVLCGASLLYVAIRRARHVLAGVGQV
jgi:hypothetical protein